MNQGSETKILEIWIDDRLDFKMQLAHALRFLIIR